jgi:SAM-dependent methyltransferase
VAIEKTLRLARRASALARRRGGRYLGYLAGGWLLPRLAYRYVYGPQRIDILGRVADAADRVAGRFEKRERRQAALAAVDRHADSVEGLLNAYHRRGLTGLRHESDRLVATTGGSYRFAGHRGTRWRRPGSLVWRRERDRDREFFNRSLGLDMLTETRARQALQAQRRKLPEGWFRDYAPIDFGGGVSIGSFVSTDSGTGRWDFFNGRIVAPLVDGKRVLDLGSNNGSLPLMMLRAGAREVVGVEQSDLLAECADLHRRILEWQDMKTYPLQIRVGDMRSFLTADWGRFDVVTAFCSIYYLPDAAMEAIVRRVAKSGATLVLQSNEGAQNMPASRQAFLKQLMERNGFDHVVVHEYPGFARLILVGLGMSAATRAPVTAIA